MVIIHRMISPPAFAPLLSPSQLDVMHNSTSDAPAPLEIQGLEDDCGLLGGNHADSFMEIDSTLNDLLVHSAPSSHEKPVLDLVQASGKQTISCICCHRHHSFEHGWMHWDHQSNLKDVHGTFRTVCEKCALALYSDVLQNTV